MSQEKCRCNEDADPGDEDDGLRSPIDVLQALIESSLVQRGMTSVRLDAPLSDVALAMALGCCGQGVICFGSRHDFACPAGAQ